MSIQRSKSSARYSGLVRWQTKDSTGGHPLKQGLARKSGEPASMRLHTAMHGQQRAAQLAAIPATRTQFSAPDVVLYSGMATSTQAALSSPKDFGTRYHFARSMQYVLLESMCATSTAFSRRGHLIGGHPSDVEFLEEDLALPSFSGSSAAVPQVLGTACQSIWPG